MRWVPSAGSSKSHLTSMGTTRRCSIGGNRITSSVAMSIWLLNIFTWVLWLGAGQVSLLWSMLQYRWAVKVKHLPLEEISSPQGLWWVLLVPTVFHYIKNATDKKYKGDDGKIPSIDLKLKKKNKKKKYLLKHLLQNICQLDTAT